MTQDTRVLIHTHLRSFRCIYLFLLRNCITTYCIELFWVTSAIFGFIVDVSISKLKH